MDEPLTSVYGGGPTALQLVLLAALALAAVALPRALRSSPLRPRDGLALGLVVLAALAVRLGAPATIFHDNSHAYTDIGIARSLIVDGTHFYGNGYFTFWYHLFRFLPGATGASLLHANAVLDACTTGLVGLLAAGLSRRAPAALITGGLYALLPVAIKAAHTETFFVLAAFLGCLGWVLAAAAVAARSLLCAAAAGLVLGFASHVRPELAVLPALTALLVVSATPALRDLWRRPHAAVVLLVQTAVAAPALLRAWSHYAAAHGAAGMLHDHAGDLLAVLSGAAPAGRPGAILADPALTPLGLPLLFLLGIAAAVRLRARWTLFPALAPAVLLAVVLPIQNAPWVAMRLQHGALALACLLPGAALAARPWRWLDSRAAAALFGLAAVSVLPVAGLVGELRAPQREFAFLRRSVPAVPDGCVVLHAGHDREIVADLPSWLSADAGLEHRWRAVGADGTAVLEPGESCVLWYRGTTCYAAPAAGYGAPPGELRPACGAFERSSRLEPWRTERIAGVTDTFYGYSQAVLEIGFFRFVPAPRAGP